MSRWLAVLLLLLSAPVFGQEDVVPNTDEASDSETSCDTTVEPSIDDDPDSPDGTECTADTCTGSSASTWDFRVGFATPSGNPTTTSEDQTFVVRVKQCSAGSGSPDVDVDLFCNGSLVEDNGVVEVSSTTYTNVSYTFTFGGTCASDGSDVEARVTCTRGGGSPSNRRSCDVDSLEWVANVTAASSAQAIVIGGE